MMASSEARLPKDLYLQGPGDDGFKRGKVV